MMAKTTSAMRGRPRWIACVRSLNTMPGRSILARMIGTVCVVPVAMAEHPTLADFPGRWVSTKKALTLDIRAAATASAA